MKRLLVVLCLVWSTVMVAQEHGPWYPLGRGVGGPPGQLTPQHLSYLGAFRAPVGLDLSFCQCALAFDPLGNGGSGSLFVAGFNSNANKGSVAEISTPTPIITSALGSLNRATQLQADTDATEGQLYLTRNGVPDVSSIQGLKVVNTTLFINAANGYDPDGTQRTSFFLRSRTLNAVGTLNGPFGPTDGLARPKGGYMADIPSAWQARFGGDTLTGLWSENTIESISSGYAAFSLNVSEVSIFGGYPFNTLLFYPAAHALGPTYGIITDGQTDPIWTPAVTGASSAVMPVGYDSVVFFGGKGVGGWCYGTGTSNLALDHTPTGDGDIYCYDPENSAKGGHGYPAKGYFWIYNANDLLVAKNNSSLVYLPRPNAFGDIATLISTFDAFNAGQPGIRGAAYDAAHNLIYLAAQKQDGAGPLFHVLQIIP